MNNLLSDALQKDILNALAVFHPHPMTASQFFDCFGDCDELQVIANIEVLIIQGRIEKTAIHICEGEKFLSLNQLKLCDASLRLSNNHDISRQSETMRG